MQTHSTPSVINSLWTGSSFRERGLNIVGGGKRESEEMAARLPPPPPVSYSDCRTHWMTDWLTANGLLTILSGIIVKFLLRHEWRPCTRLLPLVMPRPLSICYWVVRKIQTERIGTGERERLCTWQLGRGTLLALRSFWNMEQMVRCAWQEDGHQLIVPLNVVVWKYCRRLWPMELAWRKMITLETHPNEWLWFMDTSIAWISLKGSNFFLGSNFFFLLIGHSYHSPLSFPSWHIWLDSM